MQRVPLSGRWAGAALIAAAAVAVGALAVLQGPSQAADHRDGPIFVNSMVNGQQDINDNYIYQAPGNPANTVMNVTLSPFAGRQTPTTFDQRQFIDMNIDNNGDAIEDLTYRVTFGAPDGNGVQRVTVRGLPLAQFRPNGIVAQGNTGTNIPVRDGGMFRAAVQDDPFFFDAAGFNAFIADGMAPFPRPVGVADNFFGPTANVLALTLEVPSSKLRRPASPNIGMWSTTVLNGVQMDRMGRPAINTALIPPVLRNNTTFGDRRNAFNAGLPRNDVANFKANMVSILQTVYGRSAMQADGLASVLLPDILTFDVTNAGGFLNGRKLRDDVIDAELNLLTGGGITTDNVPDDNGDRITDGSTRPDMTVRPIAFPYIGAPNDPPGNLGE